MKKDATLFKRSIWYFVGLNLIAVSVVLNIRYDLGVAAFSSVMYSISEIYGISLGVASILCYGLFIVLQCLLSKKITLVFVLEIPLSIFFGLLTDFYDMLLPAFSIGMPLRILCFAATMFLNALGVYLCVKSKMVLTPTDGIVNTISEVFHLRFSLAKNAFDISMVLISVLLCLLMHTPPQEYSMTAEGGALVPREWCIHSGEMVHGGRRRGAPSRHAGAYSGRALRLRMDSPSIWIVYVL